MKKNFISFKNCFNIRSNRYFSSKFKPVIVYENPNLNKSKIFYENKFKSGIYRWVNTINNHSYIGSTGNLAYRLKMYFSLKGLENRLPKDNSLIYRALLEYKHENFRLEILEYCNKESLLSKEQYYFDTMSPKYNILKVAGSRLGAKHSLETLLKFKNRDLGTGHVTTVINQNNGAVVRYNSIRKAAKNLKVSHTTLLNYINTNKLLKSTYLINNFDNSNKILTTKLSLIEKKILIVDCLKNLTYEFTSKRKAAKFFITTYGVIVSTKLISNYIKNNKLYKNKYKVLVK
jgi:hypothetical protein